MSGKGRRIRRSSGAVLFQFSIALLLLSLGVILVHRISDRQGRGTTEVVPRAATTSGVVAVHEAAPLHAPPASVSAEAVVAVMIDNSPGARPQRGLSQAAVVVEALAEGGVPRYLAVFAGGDGSSTVGPVRSARPYFVQRAMEYAGAYVHCGGSPQALEMLSSQSSTTDIDELRGVTGFFRSTTRRAPHNLFTTLQAARRYRAARVQSGGSGVDPLAQSFELASVASPMGRDGEGFRALKVTLSRDHSVSYRYDPESRTMLRAVNGRADLDAGSGRQLSCDTLVVQFAHHRTLDKVGRLEIDLVGEGSGLIATGGRIVECTWRKPSAQDPTVYYRGTRPVAIPRGRVWIEIAPPGSAALGGRGGD